MNKYFYFHWENPLKTYNLIKKYFLNIKPKFQYEFGKKNKAKILDLSAFDLTWKDKWHSPRHEYNPRIFFSLFNYIHLYIEWTLGDHMEDIVYWEAVLNWIYYGKSLQKACTNGWAQYNQELGEYEHLIFTILKEPYQTMYNNKELKNWYYERNINNSRQ